MSYMEYMHNIIDELVDQQDQSCPLERDTRSVSENDSCVTVLSSFITVLPLAKRLSKRSTTVVSDLNASIKSSDFLAKASTFFFIYRPG